MEDDYFEIAESGNYLRLYPLQYSHYGATEKWDQKWLQTKIEVKGGSFKGSYLAELMTDDFKDLKRKLFKLYNNLNGAADFNDLERHLELKIKGDGIGHFDMQVIASDNSVYLSTLAFTFQFDQTQIPKMVAQLENIIAQYP